VEMTSNKSKFIKLIYYHMGQMKQKGKLPNCMMGTYLVWFEKHAIGKSKWSCSIEAWLYLLCCFFGIFLKIDNLNPIFYFFYHYVFFFHFFFHWFILSVVNFTLLTLCYHMRNEIRHLLWDLDLFKKKFKVYTFGIIMLFWATSLTVWKMILFYLL